MNNERSANATTMRDGRTLAHWIIWILAGPGAIYGAFHLIVPLLNALLSPLGESNSLYMSVDYVVRYSLAVVHECGRLSVPGTLPAVALAMWQVPSVANWRARAVWGACGLAAVGCYLYLRQSWM